MTRSLRAAVALATVALAAPALAQQGGRAEPKVGLGVGITNGSGSLDPGYLFFVPINATPKLRIEPFIGWTRYEVDPDSRHSDVTIGVGAFYVQPLAPQVQLYAGGRLGSRWVTDRYVNGVNGKDERRDTLFALAAGGEYLPIPRVALGAEFQLGWLSIGDTTHTAPNGIQTSGGGGSGTATQATLFARIYLF